MTVHTRVTSALCVLLILAITATITQAATVLYTLTINEQDINITGKPARGMTINGGIPGPTLHFKEGDLARIQVQNDMKVETSIHWHGLLVPPDMDGVPYLSFPPILPGKSFTYEFPIRQSGTYWYHSHTMMQEQSGVYGAIVIAPPTDETDLKHEEVVLLSDWTDEDPHVVNRTLKRGSEWYAIQKSSSQSILGAAKIGMLGDYFKRELQRMPAMDIADVAYDSFLTNGHPESAIAAKPGEKLKLRIINGSSTTYFYVEFSGGPMTIVAADGMDVEPIEEKRFLIGVAETYDVLITIPASGAYEFRATSQDGSGHASVWLGSGEHKPAADVPRPNLYVSMHGSAQQNSFALTPEGTIGMSDKDVDAGKFDSPGMAGMEAMDMGSMQGMAHKSDHAAHTTMDMTSPSVSTIPLRPGELDAIEGMTMDAVDSADATGLTMHTMPTPGQDQARTHTSGTFWGLLNDDVSSSHNLAVDGMSPGRPWPPYSRLRAIRKTALDQQQPAREIRLTLDGDMQRYVWFLNNTALSESDAIRIRSGEVVRFIMINRTMMHHPMHLHGHFFRVINEQGEYAPLKHTVSVSPMSTTVIEFPANESGDWFFHCHLLYHMEGGMARVVSYEDFDPGPHIAAIRPVLYKDYWYFSGTIDLLTNMNTGHLVLSNTRNILSAEWEVGWQDVENTEWENLVSWERYINSYLNLLAGADMHGMGDDLDQTRLVAGIRYLLPLSIESRLWVDSDGGARVTFGKQLDLTPRIALSGEAQYDTHDMWEGHVRLSYLVQKNFSIIGQYHSDYGVGAGIEIQF
jgi:CopA family copper-resistance protein